VDERTRHPGQEAADCRAGAPAHDREYGRLATVPGGTGERAHIIRFWRGGSVARSTELHQLHLPSGCRRGRRQVARSAREEECAVSDGLRGMLPGGVAFWLLGSVFFLLAFAAGAPSPLYGVYQIGADAVRA
jgi:hypothetical protein